MVAENQRGRWCQIVATVSKPSTHIFILCYVVLELGPYKPYLFCQLVLCYAVLTRDTRDRLQVWRRKKRKLLPLCF